MDTNVVVSAVLSQGSPPDSILQSWRRGAFQLVTSAPLLRELQRVLARPHIAHRLGWSAQERNSFLADFSESATVVIPNKRLDVVKVDPADNRVLEAAVEGQADFVVSGDHDLLDIGSYEGIEIVTPARFNSILATSQQP